MKRRPSAPVILTIRQAAEMTTWRRSDVAKWLRKQAEFLEKDGKKFSRLFTARYFYG